MGHWLGGRCCNFVQICHKNWNRINSENLDSIFSNIEVKILALSKVDLMKFFIARKNCFVLEIFRSSCFSWIQTSKFVTSSWSLLHLSTYIFTCFFWILCIVKIKLGIAYDKHLQLFTCSILRLETSPRPFNTLRKWQYQEIC